MLDPLPKHLYTNLPSYGMTGSQKDPNPVQLETILNIMVFEEGLEAVDGFWWHFGDCIGSDAAAFDAVNEMFPVNIVTVAWPGTDPKRRANKPASEIHRPAAFDRRNERIAYCSHQGLFALPSTHSEIMRSGTWQTVRFAWKLGRKIWVIDPDGNVNREFKSVLVKQVVRDKEATLWGL
jgi:hypothetical protein